MHDEAVYAERALRAGARGYVTKQEIDDTILIAIRSVLLGEIHLSPAMRHFFSEKFLSAGKRGGIAALEALSDRELEVLKRIGGGDSTRAIALALGLSVKTIESHREHIKTKLKLPTGAAVNRCAILWAQSGRMV
jgi:DNA-binding NarL/FixJ family response regulator